MKWRCCCCGRVFHHQYQRHRCATGYTKSWRKVAKSLGMADGWTRYYEFGDYELQAKNIWVRSVYVVDYDNGKSEIDLAPAMSFYFQTGLVVVLGETSLEPSLQISEAISVA